MPLPLLSGLPPLQPTPTCRACATSFLPLLNPRKTCYHCGFSWCLDHLSIDHKALMPRSEGGYDEKNVCSCCWTWVKMSSSTPQELAILPVKQLVGYLTAYGIALPAGAVEKTELVKLISRSVGPERVQPPAREKFYRENSVPRGFVQQAGSSSSAPAPRPPPAANAWPAAAAGRPPPTARTTPQPSTTSGSTSRPPRPPAASTTSARPTAQPTSHSHPPRPNARPPPARTQPEPPASVPPRATHSGDQLLAQLLALDLQEQAADQAASFPVGALKAVLNAQNVRHDGVLEKRELVAKVLGLVRDERERLERQAEREREDRLATGPAAVRQGGREEWEEIPGWLKEEWAASAANKPEPSSSANGVPSASPVTESPAASNAPSKPPAASRQSRPECVICCDNDATHAPIACGHLSLCKGCSDEVLKTSRECALCRTPIGTNGFIRIFV